MITSVSSVQSAPEGTSANTPKTSTLDYDAFLTLLVAQLKNQDPTKPMESTEYVAQLATFSNVEQSISANNKLDELLRQSRLSQGIDLIGKYVVSLDGEGNGTVETVRFANDSVIAVLESGLELVINERVTVGNEPD